MLIDPSPITIINFSTALSFKSIQSLQVRVVYLSSITKFTPRCHSVFKQAFQKESTKCLGTQLSHRVEALFPVGKLTQGSNSTEDIP